MKLRLEHSVAQGFAGILPLLSAAELSAEMAFAALKKNANPQDQVFLAEHEKDEAKHYAWVKEWQQQLPFEFGRNRKAGRFFITLAEGGVTRHFARMASLDGAACHVLAACTAPPSLLHQDPSVVEKLNCMRRDEARHAAYCFSQVKQWDDIAKEDWLQVRLGFSQLLIEDASYFFAMGVDLNALLLRLQNPPGPLLKKTMAYHLNQTPLNLLAATTQLPNQGWSTPDLLAKIASFGHQPPAYIAKIIQGLQIDFRYVCREFASVEEKPILNQSNPDLAAAALKQAIQVANSHPSFVIGHTATPAMSLPPNTKQTLMLLGMDCPFLELRQACTGVTAALSVAAGLLALHESVAIIGSETGSLYCKLGHAFTKADWVNALQMGDGAACLLISQKRDGIGKILAHWHGHLPLATSPGLMLPMAGSDHRTNPETGFVQNFSAISKCASAMIDAHQVILQELGIDYRTVDAILPHQANGRMAQWLAPILNVPEDKILTDGRQTGNLGSAGLGVAFSRWVKTAKQGQTLLVLGMEATGFMYGGWLYRHGV